MKTYAESSLLLMLMLTLALVGCTERKEACYEPNPDPEAGQPPFPQVCGQPYGYLPESPAGLEDRGPYHMIYCEPPGEGLTCETCSVDDVNERIREELLSLMAESGWCTPGEVDEIRPACVTLPETERDQCCFNAWYWGSCNIKG